MDDTVGGHGRTDPPTGEVAWRDRLAEDRATMDDLRQDAVRVSSAIAVTERAVASTLRTLAAEDRERGRTAAAARREARARDAELFAAQERAAAAALAERAPRSDDRP